MKKYIIIAGINGAGKSSFYKLDRRKRNSLLENSIRLNPDEILREAGYDWRDSSAQQWAARKSAKLLRTLLSGDKDFHRETILSGGVGSHKTNIERAKKSGFQIHLIYIALDSVNLAKQRIAQRVAKGGHGIPDEVVERRYHESLRNLKEILPLVDEIDIFDNSANALKLVYSKSETIEIDRIKNFPYLEEYIH